MRKVADKIMEIVFLVLACVSIVAVVIVCYFMFSRGIPAIRQIGLGEFITGKIWKPTYDYFGILPMIVGSLMVTAGALVIGVPVGIFMAVFMARFCPRIIYKIANPIVNLLAGIPSIIYGFFGMMIVVPFIREHIGGKGYSILSASIILEALVKGDADKAREAVEFDDTIDQTQKDIESLCMRILLMQQPVATDLRFVSTALKLVTDMERIGDHAADISEITISLVGSEYVKDLDVIKEMAAKTSGMVIKSVESYVSRNTEEAKEVIAYDDVIDDLFIMEKDEIVRMIGENPKCGSEATDLLMIAKYFERIGDHASNIAEWALYAKTGDINVIQ